MSTQTDPTRNPSSFALALTGGAGLVLMLVALGAGVVDSNADGTVIGVTFAAGVLLLLLGVVGWFVLTKPYTHFDDINQPKYTGHHGDHHDEPHDENAIIPYE